MHDVWTGPVVSQLRADLNAGGSKFCGDCPLKLPLKKDEAPPVRPVDAGPLPSRMYIECTAACNISCTQACCAPETGITRTRQAGMLDFDLFRRVIDEAGPSLGRIDFFNYGEAFLHKRAVEMCEYIKTKFPHIYLYTSTNGLALTEAQARRLVHSGIDEVTFSIDGATQESYVKYRQRGRFDVAIANLRAMADEKRRVGPRRAVPQLALHPVQLERQRRGDGRARGSWPPRSASTACAGRSPTIPRTRTRGGSCRARRTFEAIRHEIWDDNNLGNAIPGATPRARIDVRTLVPGLPLRWSRGPAGRCRSARASTTSRRAPFPAQASYGRRLVRLGAQLCAADGTLINRDFARAWLPQTLGPGRPADVAIEIPAPEQPGRYALKFDLVSEGIDWFERCGSPTTTRSLWVR